MFDALIYQTEPFYWTNTLKNESFNIWAHSFFYVILQIALQIVVLCTQFCILVKQITIFPYVTC